MDSLPAPPRSSGGPQLPNPPRQLSPKLSCSILRSRTRDRNRKCCSPSAFPPCCVLAPIVLLCASPLQPTTSPPHHPSRPPSDTLRCDPFSALHLAAVRPPFFCHSCLLIARDVRPISLSYAYLLAHRPKVSRLTSHNVNHLSTLVAHISSVSPPGRDHPFLSFTLSSLWCLAPPLSWKPPQGYPREPLQKPHCPTKGWQHAAGRTAGSSI